MKDEIGSTVSSEAEPRRTMARQAQARLRDEIVRGVLAPGDRLSEAETARRLGVSRQPVREAFIMLAEQGLVRIRPQRPTEIAPVSEAAVLNAAFVRAALEDAVLRRAVARDAAGLATELRALIDRQRAADGDRAAFHALDEAFHQRICEAAGAAFVWGLIDAQKAQMDRARWLTLGFNNARTLGEHAAIADAVAAGDADAAGAAMGAHLGAIGDALPRLRAEHPDFFAAAPA